MVHHYIGYLVMFLVTLGNIGAILILPVSMGGEDFSLYFAIIYLSIATSGAMYLAWYNIKRRQIDQHRKWILRAMFSMGIIVTMRIIQFFMVIAVAFHGGYATVSHQILFPDSFNLTHRLQALDLRPGTICNQE
jgi:hypothetical protein